VPPDRAWEAIACFAQWPTWGLSIADVDARERRVRAGLTGRVKLRFGFWLPFEITAVDEGRRWDWAVAGVPATGHLVEPHAEGCRVTFTAPWWAVPYRIVLAQALVELERSLPRSGGPTAR